MAYPTTRKARWNKRRQKHLRRGKKEQRRRHRTYNFGVLVSDTSASRLYPRLGRMMGHTLTWEWYNASLPHLPAGPVNWYVLSPVGRGDPPHVTMIAPFYVTQVASGEHFRIALANIHRRNVLRRGLHAGRMNGQQRREWGAEMFARQNGFYPDWDVLGRQPSETAVANGAPELPIATDPYWTDYQPYQTPS